MLAPRTLVFLPLLQLTISGASPTCEAVVAAAQAVDVDAVDVPEFVLTFLTELDIVTETTGASVVGGPHVRVVC